MANGVARLTHLFANVIADQAVEEFRALLTFVNNVEHLFALIGGEFEFLSHAADEFFADRTGLQQYRTLLVRAGLQSRCQRFDHDRASDEAGNEDGQGSQDFFPGTHQV